LSVYWSGIFILILLSTSLYCVKQALAENPTHILSSKTQLNRLLPSDIPPSHSLVADAKIVDETNNIMLDASGHVVARRIATGFTRVTNRQFLTNSLYLSNNKHCV
jgi:hypothetical protein